MSPESEHQATGRWLSGRWLSGRWLSGRWLGGRRFVGSWPTKAWATGLAVVMLVAGVGFLLWPEGSTTTDCAATVVPKDQLRSPIESAPPFTDPRVGRLAESLSAFGTPIAGVGYDYDRWLNLVALQHDLVAWTKRNSTWTLLDGTDLSPRWGARAPKAGMTWDASADRFFEIDLGNQTRVVARQMSDGKAIWCTPISGRATIIQIATAVTHDNGLVIATPSGNGYQIQRLSGRSGAALWKVPGPTSHPRLTQLDESLLLAGGMSFGEAFDADNQAQTNHPSVRAINLADGTTPWQWTSPHPGTLHLVGLDRETALLAAITPNRVHFYRLNAQGQAKMLFSLPGQDVQATVRFGVIITREQLPSEHLVGRDAISGEVRWELPIRSQPQYFPYGYDLAGAPSLPDGQILLGATDALVALDVDSGKGKAFALPTDGISTTYWPYQLALTADGALTGVVTNIGAVVVTGQPTQ